jgi:Flp pilus assembly pilin Flp
MILFEYVNRVMAWHKSRDRGASAVEYGLLVAAIVGVSALLFFFLGNNIRGQLLTACANITGDANCSPAP